ncbi:hypothetical protein RG836_20995 [Pseudomonas sp. SZMC_28357]|uniref:hypothetical protein n=1 Tax=Pseudomonas sp. SZMC_28357 TaxID=3074380 RepID=UPI0028729CC4|nr:hypothetical protein [Pseudomonas sp. SZMC_28357]MDR9753933.1 hypothetical protein [Pseudomonas sp. SZMC_28357]
MPYRPAARRSLSITVKPLQLSLGIALGLWLGFLAIALTAWLLSKAFSAQVVPVATNVQQLTQPPAMAQPVPDIPPQSPLFEQYKQNLNKYEQQQALDQARGNTRNLSNPKCQFWLQQDQTAPSEKSRANVMQFCD